MCTCTTCHWLRCLQHGLVISLALPVIQAGLKEPSLQCETTGAQLTYLVLFSTVPVYVVHTAKQHPSQDVLAWGVKQPMKGAKLSQSQTISLALRSPHYTFTSGAIPAEHYQVIRWRGSVLLPHEPHRQTLGSDLCHVVRLGGARLVFYIEWHSAKHTATSHFK